MVSNRYGFAAPNPMHDHPVVRLALHQFFESCIGIHVAGQAQNTGEAFELLLNANLNVLMLDIDLPGRGGLDVIGVFRRKAPKVGIIVFSGHPQEQYAAKLFRMGAQAFILKNSELEVLVNAVRRVAEGDDLFCHAKRNRCFLIPRVLDLTPP